MSHSIHINGLVKFLAATPLGRARVAAELTTRGEYLPGEDYWWRARTAVQADRRTTRDGQAVWAAVQNAPDKRRGNFERVAQGWDAVLGRWETSEAVSLGKRTIDLGGLSVTVSPTFVERRPDGVLEVVMCRFVVDELPPDVRRATLRVLQRAFPEAEPVLVDVPRQKVYVADSRLAKLDPWIVSEAAGLAFLISQAA